MFLIIYNQAMNVVRGVTEQCCFCSQLVDEDDIGIGLLTLITALIPKLFERYCYVFVIDMTQWL